MAKPTSSGLGSPTASPLLDEELLDDDELLELVDELLDVELELEDDELLELDEEAAGVCDVSPPHAAKPVAQSKSNVRLNIRTPNKRWALRGAPCSSLLNVGSGVATVAIEVDDGVTDQRDVRRAHVAVLGLEFHAKC